MTQDNLTPDNTEDLEFRVQKFEYNQYQLLIDANDIKGILRVVTVPTRILKFKETADGKPRFFMYSVNALSFVNTGEYGEPNPTPLTSEELESNEKLDITDYLDVLIEPYNIYITVNTKPHFAIRAKSTVIKAELLPNRFDYYGNPVFNVQVNTAISYAFYKSPHN
jgi:hypothetical protein